MEFSDFKIQIRKNNSIGNLFNYLKAIFAILAGLFFFYQLNFTDWYESKKLTTENIASKELIYLLIIFIIAGGVYGFWRIPRLYSITKIYSSLTITIKNDIVENLIVELNMIEEERHDNVRYLRYSGNFKNPFEISIYFDEEKFCYNSMQVDYDGGFIDFGTSSRASRKIKKKIKELISKTPNIK